MATPASGTEPAGGAAIGQVVLATAMAGVAFAVLAWLCMGHRAGTVPYLGRAAATTERIAGIPGWAALPSFLSALSRSMSTARGFALSGGSPLPL